MKEIVELISEAALEKKASDLKVLNMEGITSLADYFIILSTANKKQAQSVADNVESVLKTKGIPLLHEEGYRNGTWILQDFGGVILHVFVNMEREYYDLDSLWGNALIEKEITGE